MLDRSRLPLIINRASRWFFLFLLCCFPVFIFACAENIDNHSFYNLFHSDDDFTQDDDSSNNEDTIDDDFLINDDSVSDDDPVGDDDSTLDDDLVFFNDDFAPDDDTATDDDSACAQPQVPPYGYWPYEAVWIVSRFDNPELPVYGLYTYFWIDWYMYQGCSYTGAVAVLYKKESAENDNSASGGLSTGYTIDYLSSDLFDVFVHPHLHFRSDFILPDSFQFEVYGDGFEGSFSVNANHLMPWTPFWYSFYDSTIEYAYLNINGRDYYPTGQATVERWFHYGGYEPGSDQSDIVHGYWLYEPFYWEAEDGDRISTDLLYWFEKTDDYSGIRVHKGRLSQGDQEWDVEKLILSYDFPENIGTNGYLRRHTMSGLLSNGDEFFYEATVVSEFMDQYPVEWLPLFPPDRRQAHSFLTGTLQYNGKIYYGGGVYEWQVTTYNPLADLGGNRYE